MHRHLLAKVILPDRHIRRTSLGLASQEGRSGGLMISTSFMNRDQETSKEPFCMCGQGGLLTENEEICGQGRAQPPP